MAYDKVVDSAMLDGALTGIADAIRGKTGGTDKLTLEGMAAAIAGLSVGDNGITPHIGANGNWFIGDTDTGNPSRGEPGSTPVKGVDYFTEAEVQEIAEIAAEMVEVPDTPAAGGDNLIAKYVHSGNDVIRPSALDLATGVFTCASHGLTTGDCAMVIPDGYYSAIPFELLSQSTQSTNSLKIRVVDDDSFTLQYGGEDLTYGNAVNTTVDVGAFHIEISNPATFVIEGFSEAAVEVRISGYVWGTTNYNLQVVPMADGNSDETLLSLFGQVAYGAPSVENTGRVCQLVSGTAVFDATVAEYRMFTMMPPTAEADYTYLQKWHTLIAFNSRSKGVVTQFIMPVAAHERYTAVALIARLLDYHYTIMLANGFTVEVYRRG